MPVANKEFIMNYAVSRWKLNRKSLVGNICEHIRVCKPQTLQDWKTYYLSYVDSKMSLNDVGRELYNKIRYELSGEMRFHPHLLESITLTDCQEYMRKLVFDKTFEGYRKTCVSNTIYSVLSYCPIGDR